MDNSTINSIQGIIGYNFKNKRLLEQAFVRKSYSKEHPEMISNEVLEFYGDVALDYYISREMYKEFSEILVNKQFSSKRSEQKLTEIKSNNVNTNTLAHCIALIGFNQYLLMNKSDIKNNAQNSVSVMADLFESIVGAVVVDTDWDYKTISCVCKNLLTMVDFDIDYISWVKNWCAERGYMEPRYSPSMSNYMFSQFVYLGLQRSSFNIPHYISHLSIVDLHLSFDSNGATQYAAHMDCAKQAYYKIQTIEMKEIVGSPKLEESVSQLNVLYQKEYIAEPKYYFYEEHDENGNPIWECNCKIEELGDEYWGKSAIKKESKRQAAYKAICSLTGTQNNRYSMMVPWM